MTDAVLAVPGAPLADHPLAVALHESGHHVGILYAFEGETWFLHLTGNRELTRGSARGDFRWVVPARSKDQLLRVLFHVLAVAEFYDEGGLPYGFDPRGARFAPHGALLLDGSEGLTCASLVTVLFADVNLPIVQLETWLQVNEDRRAEDRADQEAALEQLKGRPWSTPEWLHRLRQEIGRGPRVRPVEVAAASGMSPLPVPFLRAEPAGKALLIAIQSVPPL